MDVLIQIIASGLTLGAMYAVATIGLSLVYGSLNMLNMAHGAILTLGGYICYAAIIHAGLHTGCFVFLHGIGSHGNDHRLFFEVKISYTFCGFQAIHVGHEEIHEDKIGLQLPRFIDGVQAVDGFTADFPVRRLC